MSALSLRSRLFLGAAAAALALLTATGAISFGLVRRTLLEGFDATLTADSKALAGLLSRDDGRWLLRYDEAVLGPYESARAPVAFELTNEDGRSLLRAPSLGAARLPRLEPGAAIQEGALPDGRPARLTTRLIEGEDRRGRLVVARALGPLEAQLRFLFWVFGATFLGGAGLAFSLIRVVVRRGLGPLSGLAEEIAALGPESLSSRIGEGGRPRELAPVVRRLNELLDRVDAAFEREKRLSADLAHELRTPIAGLRSTLEITASRPRDPEDYQEAIADSLEIVAQMQGLVESLLTLARMEAGLLSARRQSLALGEAIDQAWSPLAEKARGRGLRLERSVPDKDTLSADPELLGIALANTFSNAVEYGRGAVIVLEAAIADGALDLRVTNEAEALSEGDQARLFERFWRGDPARAADGLHCGLGLALIRRAMRTMGGEAKAAYRDGRFVMELRLG